MQFRNVSQQNQNSHQRNTNGAVDQTIAPYGRANVISVAGLGTPRGSVEATRAVNQMTIRTIFERAVHSLPHLRKVY